MPNFRPWLIIAVAALALSACGWREPLRPSPSPSPSPSAVSPLLTLETRGGLCPQGACGSTIVVESDGRVHATAPVPAELGTLPASTLDGLVTEIAAADFVALKSDPFTGTCPIAYDGQETIYTFATSSGAVRIASCEVVVDPAHPLFVAVSAVLGGLPAR